MIRAELWAIRFVFNLCKDRNWEGVPAETNFLTTVKLKEGEEDEEKHPERILFWLKIVGVSLGKWTRGVVHILIEGNNRCADKLARMGERAVRMFGAT